MTLPVPAPSPVPYLPDSPGSRTPARMRVPLKVLQGSPAACPLDGTARPHGRTTPADTAWPLAWPPPLPAPHGHFGARPPGPHRRPIASLADLPALPFFACSSPQPAASAAPHRTPPRALGSAPHLHRLRPRILLPATMAAFLFSS